MNKLRELIEEYAQAKADYAVACVSIHTNYNQAKAALIRKDKAKKAMEERLDYIEDMAGFQEVAR